MKYRILLISILSFAAWIHPIKVASAIEQNHIDETIFINYEQFHKNPAEISRPSGPTKSKSTVEDRVFSGRNYSKEEVQDLIRTYSKQYGIHADTPMCIARMESGFNQFSANRSSSARGVYQYLSSTWLSTDEGKAGLSVYDADANVRAAIKYMASRLNTKPWVVGKSCPQIIKTN